MFGILRQVLDRLANDFELPDERVLSHFVCHERITAGTCVLLDVLNGFEDVPEVDAIVLHKGRTSARMCGRIAGCTLLSVSTSTFR